MAFDLQEYKGKKLHIIGIGGSMMSGIAGILLDNGVRVSGTDQEESKTLNWVRRMGASVKGGHHEDYVYDQDLVIYSAAVAQDHPELRKARQLKIPTMTRSEFLGYLLKNFSQSVGIAGTHGKTSTTALLTSITMEAGLDPTVLIGAHVPLLDSNYRVGKSEVMVVESCEYQRSFLDFPPHIAVLLNIEEDHVDTYRDLEEIRQAFRQYVLKVPPNGRIIANADDPDVMAVAADAPAGVLTFGIDAGEIRARSISMDNMGRATFDLLRGEELLFNIHLPIPGIFNIYNALAAAAAALTLGVGSDAIRRGLLGYQGVDRRLQELGTLNEVRFIDDYGHHPTEVRVTIETVLHYDYKKLIVLMQPLTYSRLHHFMDDFVPLFDKADLTILLPVYTSREVDTGLTSSNVLGDAIRARSTVECVNAESYEDAANLILQRANPGDIVLSIGGGEGYKVYDLLEINEEIKAQKTGTQAAKR